MSKEVLMPPPIEKASAAVFRSAAFWVVIGAASVLAGAILHGYTLGQASDLEPEELPKNDCIVSHLTEERRREYYFRRNDISTLAMEIANYLSHDPLYKHLEPGDYFKTDKLIGAGALPPGMGNPDISVPEGFWVEFIDYWDSDHQILHVRIYDKSGKYWMTGYIGDAVLMGSHTDSLITRIESHSALWNFFGRVYSRALKEEFGVTQEEEHMILFEGASSGWPEPPYRLPQNFEDYIQRALADYGPRPKHITEPYRIPGVN